MSIWDSLGQLGRAASDAAADGEKGLGVDGDDAEKAYGPLIGDLEKAFGVGTVPSHAGPADSHPAPYVRATPTVSSNPPAPRQVAVTHENDGSTTTQYSDGSYVRTYADGTTVNGGPYAIQGQGTVTTHHPDGSTDVREPNGTITRHNPDGSWSTTQHDGTQDIHSADGTVTHRTSDGTTTVYNKDGTSRVEHADGSSLSFDAHGNQTGGLAVGAQAPTPDPAGANPAHQLTTADLKHTGDKVALNPQPLPPKVSDVHMTDKPDLIGTAAPIPQPMHPNAADVHTPSFERYDDNLIAWGDSKFRQDTGESIHAATATYGRAADLLGPRPQPITGGANPQPVSSNAPEIHLTPAEVNVADHLDKVALNPQPLPPKAPDLHLTSADLSRTIDKVALNPQPLPPKAPDLHAGKTDLTNHGVTVNGHGADQHYPAGLGHTDMKQDESIHLTGHDALAHDFTHHDTGHHGG